MDCTTVYYSKKYNLQKLTYVHHTLKNSCRKNKKNFFVITAVYFNLQIRQKSNIPTENLPLEMEGQKCFWKNGLI